MATAPPKEEKIPPTQTPEEIAAVAKKEGDKPVEGKAIDGFTSRFIPRPAGEKPLIEPKKKPEAPPAKPPKKPKPGLAPAPAPASTALTADEIAEAAARGAATALKKPEPAATETKPDDAVAKLPEREQRKISVLKQMEKDNPDQYTGVAERYQKSLSALVEYADKWEKENPGETFDEDVPEHKEFVDKNAEGLDWDEDDYVEARVELKFASRDAEARKQNETLTASQERVKAALPAIAETRLKASRSLLAMIGSEYEAVIDDKGVVNKDAHAKLAAEDPVKTEIVIRSADYVEQLIAQNYALFNQITPYDVNNPLHSTISNFILQKEQALLKKPVENQRDAKGRPFKSAAEYWKLPEDRRNKCWTFSQKDVEALLVNVVYKQAKSQIEIEDKKFESRAKARGINLESAGGKQPIPPKPETNVHVEKPVEDEEEDGKPNTPDVVVPSRAAGGGTASDTSPQSLFQKKFLGKE